MAEALAVSTIADHMLGGGLDERRLDLALRLEDPFRQTVSALRPTLIAGYLMLFEGNVERAVRLLRQCRTGILERGEESDLPLAASCLAWAESWRGRLAIADRHVDEALAAAARLESPAAQCVGLAYASVVNAYQGRVALAREQARTALRLATETGNENASLWARWGLGVAALSMGDAEAVDEALGPVARLVERDGLAEPVAVMFLADEIEALVVLGELDRAERLVDVLEEAGSRLGRAWALVGAHRWRALLYAARGELGAAGKSAAAALEWCEGLELRLEVARTLLVAGQIERRRKRKVAARHLLERSREIFSEAGAHLWAERAHAELERVGGCAAGSLLTASETYVAELSASGLTNRKVAALANVSPKTVESHLVRIYHKLGIHSRAELGDRLGPGVGASRRDRETPDSSRRSPI